MTACPKCGKEMFILRYKTDCDVIICINCKFYAHVDRGKLHLGIIRVDDSLGLLGEKTSQEKQTISKEKIDNKIKTIPMNVGDFILRATTTISGALELAKSIREKENKKPKLLDLSTEIGTEICAVYASNQELAENKNPVWEQKVIDDWKDLWS
jgi:hypothetical protein